MKGSGTQESRSNEKDVSRRHSLESEESYDSFSTLKGLPNYFVSYFFESMRLGGKGEIDEDDEEKGKPNEHHQSEENH